MTQKQSWSAPELHTYGAASQITKNDINFDKKIGTGDSILLVIGGNPVTVVSPTGGSLINITVK